jgi:hypothetical protein
MFQPLVQKRFTKAGRDVPGKEKNTPCEKKTRQRPRQEKRSDIGEIP